MSSLLDTSVLISLPRFDPVAFGEWAVSVVSVGELEAGVLTAREASDRALRLRNLAAIITRVPVLVIDRRVATYYAELRAATGSRSSNDLWIAATALAGGHTLITADERQASLPLVETRLVASI